MDHEEAVRYHAADRYLVGDLPAGEREAFEEHYFSCAECAGEVRAGEYLRANIRAVLREQRDARWVWHRLLDWLRPQPQPVLAASWAVAAALLAVTAYQNLVVVPGLRDRLAQADAPQAYQSFALRSVTRGDDFVLTLPTGQRYVGLRVDVDPQFTFRQYRAEILNQAGSRILSIDSPPPNRPGDPLEFLLLSTSVPAGSYALVLYGLDNVGQSRETQVGTYRFRTEAQADK